jgi:hypothetical protein
LGDRAALSVRLAAAGVVVVLATIVAAGLGTADGRTSSHSFPHCARLPQLAEPVHLRPADFSANINNPQWPMTVGSRCVYRVTDYSDGSVKHQLIRVTKHTKLMGDGIRARVISDIVTEHGKPSEVTKDWYAQDKLGNVWYFGEHTIQYVNGHPQDNGTWQAGVNGAMPGVALPANPKVGCSYREEFARGIAEDQSRVLALDSQAQVPAGHFKPTLMTEDFSPIEPNVSEIKYYAKGSGQAVLAVDVSGGTDMEQLVKYTH